MLACGFITSAQRDEAVAEPIDASWHASPQSAGIADGLLPTLAKLKHAKGACKTTIDADTQRQAYNALSQQVALLQASNIDAAAAVVLDTQTSQLLAAVSIQAGGRQGNDLTRRPRSPGSALKPFIYAAAFDAGIIGPKSILDDSPSAWPGYQPNDFDRAFRGQISAEEALAESRNIPAMLVLERVGIEPAAGVMAAAGMSRLAESPERFGLTLAVGGADVSPMELAAAYAVLGRGGLALPVRLQAETDKTKSVLVLTAGACWQVLQSLSNADRTRIVATEAVRTQVAWKTGTSSGRRDAWCAAVTRTRTIVIWLGNLSGAGSASLVGQDAAAPVALRLMAGLCPAQEPWPIAPNATRRPLQAKADDSSLIITSPAPETQIVLSSDLPRDRQRVLLNAAVRGAQASPALWWFVDDQPVATVPAAGSVWWNASPGKHVVRVVDVQQRSATAHISVR
jgi:penicillin-binding protein 1C